MVAESKWKFIVEYADFCGTVMARTKDQAKSKVYAMYKEKYEREPVVIVWKSS